MTAEVQGGDTALVIVDLQQHFFDETPRLLNTPLLVHAADALRAARECAMPVIHVITRYRRDKADWPAAWCDRPDIWCLEGTDGAAVREEVAPVDGELVVVKHRFSGFFGTSLADHLHDLGVHRLLIAGFALDVCVRMTAFDAYNHGFAVCILEDCVEAGREDQASALEYITFFTRAEVGPAADMISRYAGGAAPLRRA